jgi:hypothetical protein
MGILGFQISEVENFKFEEASVEVARFRTQSQIAHQQGADAPHSPFLKSEI